MVIKMFNLCIMVALVALVKQAKPTGIVYIKEDSGSTEVSCGPITNPCKYLHQAVFNCVKGGKVIVQESVTVTNEIEIKEDISIIGLSGATITGGTTSGFVFRITQPITCTLTGLNFQELAVVSIQSSATVNVNGCLIEHSYKPKQGEAAKREKRNSDYEKREKRGFAIGGKMHSNLSRRDQTNSIYSIREKRDFNFGGGMNLNYGSGGKTNLNFAKRGKVNSNPGTGGKSNSNLANKEKTSSKYAIFGLPPSTGKITLVVSNSTVKGHQEVHVIHLPGFFSKPHHSSITFEDCHFSQNSGIKMTNVDNLILKLIGCKFSDNGVVMKGVDTYSNNPFQPNQLILTNCIFGNITGEALNLYDIYFSTTITDSEFKNCTGGETIGGGAISIADGRQNSKSSLVIKRCLFDNNVSQKRGGDIVLTSVGGTTTIEDCTFQNSRASAEGGSIFSTSSKLILRNCTFTRCSALGKGGAVYIDKKVGGGSFTRDSFSSLFQANLVTPGGSSQLSVEFWKCTFSGNKAVSNGGAIAVATEGAFKIQSCDLDNNIASMGGGLWIYLHEEKTKIDVQLTMDNTIFSNNAATMGGGVYINKEMSTKQEGREHSISIRSCRFVNNSASASGQSIYNNDNIQIDDISVMAVERFSAPHLFLEKGKISISNVSVKLLRDTLQKLPGKSNTLVFKSSKKIVVLKGLTISCPKNFRIDKVKNITVKTIDTIGPTPLKWTAYTFLSVDCIACPVASYNLQTGRYHIQQIPYLTVEVDAFSTLSQPEDFPTIINNTECMPCPTGAICDVGVTAVDNFWGYEDDASKLSFELCPAGFCCGSKTVPCTSYNTCADGRKGTLCGSCSDGYKQNFIANNCIQKGNACDQTIFEIYFIMYTVVYTALFILITNIKDIIYLVKQLVTKESPVSEHNGAETKDTNEDNKMAIEENVTMREDNTMATEDIAMVSGDNLVDDQAMPEDSPCEEEKFPIAGFVQLVILFFQVAGLLQIKFQDGKKDSPSNEGVRESIRDVFNFRFTVYQEVCPSDDLTLPEKEMFLFSMKVATFVILFLLVIIDQGIKGLLRCCRYTSVPQTNADTEDPSIELMSGTTVEKSPVEVSNKEVATLSFFSMLKCTFIKLLKLYFAPVTKSALMMIHCVNIHGQSHLYVYGDHLCYSGWQIGIICVILPSILMFPICFDISLRLLREREISSMQFVFSAGCPFYTILLYILKRTRHNRGIEVKFSEEEDLFRDTILEGEELLFKEVEDRSLGWQTIQLYRALAITILNTFLTNPIYRQMSYIVLLVVFVVHDRNRKPYKHEFLNLLQSITSRFLILILVCNIISAISYMVNVQTIPLLHDVVKVLGVVELMVYAAVPLSLPVWKIMKTFIKTSDNSFSQSRRGSSISFQSRRGSDISNQSRRGSGTEGQLRRGSGGSQLGEILSTMSGKV